MIYEGNVKGITLCCTLSQTGIFQNPARLYKPSKPSVFSQKRNGSGDGQDIAERVPSNKKGWIIVTGKFSWPKGLSIRICNRFAQQRTNLQKPKLYV